MNEDFPSSVVVAAGLPCRATSALGRAVAIGPHGRLQSMEIAQRLKKAVGTIGDQLRRLTGRGLLVQVGHGVYASAAPSDVRPEPIDPFDPFDPFEAIEALTADPRPAVPPSPARIDRWPAMWEELKETTREEGEG